MLLIRIIIFIFLSFIYISMFLYKLYYAIKINIKKQYIRIYLIINSTMNFIIINLIFMFTIIIFYRNLKTIHWYILFVMIGIVNLCWCYYTWDPTQDIIPYFDKCKITVAIKKLLFYILIMIFSFISNYLEVKYSKLNLQLLITNLTIINGFIVFDRIFNQLQIIFSERQKKE